MQAIYHRSPKYTTYKRQTVAPRRLNIKQSTDTYKHPASMTEQTSGLKNDFHDEIVQVLISLEDFPKHF